MAFNAYQQSIVDLYIAAYARVPEQEGLDYWVNELITGSKTLADIRAFFMSTTYNEEAASLFDGTTPEEQITDIYNNVFGREPDAEGLAYWTARLNGGESVADLMQVMIDFVRYSGNSDVEVLNNKSEVAEYFLAVVPEDQQSGNQISTKAISASDASVDTAKANIDTLVEEIAANGELAIHTLQKTVTEIVTTSEEVFWGDPDCEDCNITYDDFTTMLEEITGAELAAFGDGDIAIDAETQLTDIIIVNGDDPANANLVFTTATGEQFTSELGIAQEYIALIEGLIYYTDENGNKFSRFTSKEVEVSSYKLTPVILTQTYNNGTTFEGSLTSDKNDFIVAGQAELLHGAYIDGGAGYNTVEVDMKGVYAQPLALLHIQEVRVHNLPNVYDEFFDLENLDDHEDGYHIPDYDYFLDPDQLIQPQSILDLSRVINLTTLVVSEGRATHESQSIGDLTIVGVRGNATVVLEGMFSAENVNIFYAQGLENAINLTLNLGDVDGTTFSIFHNSNTVNINSIGGGNVMSQANFGDATLMNMNISGSAVFVVSDSIAANFTSVHTATIDASANTAGVNLNMDGFSDKVVFKGTAFADDRFSADNNAKEVHITGGQGDNEFSANNGKNVSITSGDGKNVIESTGSESVTIKAGNGGNTITVDQSATVSVTAGSGIDTVSALQVESATINVDGGNNIVNVSAKEITLTATTGNDLFTVAGISGAGSFGAAESVNLMLILDDSGSMAGTNFDDQKAAITALLDAYETAGTNVAIKIYEFSPTVENSGQDADAWLTIAQARLVIETLNANGGTDFDGVISDIIADEPYAELNGYISGGANVAIFTSDGDSSMDAQTTANWEDYCDQHNIVSNGFGIGTGANLVAIEPIAYDGVSGNQLSVIAVDNSADLTDAILETIGSVSLGNKALINIDMGSGNNTLHIGNDTTMAQGLVAYEGSVITGEDIKMIVNADADFRAVDITGVTSVVLDNGTGSTSTGTDNAVLTLTDTQFAAIGAANFSAEGTIFNTHATIEIIVTQSTSLTDLGVDNLPRNIDLKLMVNDGVTLEMTAEQLHTKVAPNGVTLSIDASTDYANGKVVITDAGASFDPFNTNDTIKTNIDGTVYVGGSLSPDFIVNGNWYNVDLQSVYKGYDRPQDVPVEQVLTIDADLLAGEAVEALSTWHTNLLIKGSQDVTFEGVLQLGELQGDAANTFNIDFSELAGTVSGMTIDHFELLANGGSIAGNAAQGYDTELFIHIAADEANTVGFDEDDANSLVSTGVAKYMVSQIDGSTAPGVGSTATIKFCDTTQDLETIGLIGNYNDTLIIEDAAWGTGFELQGGSYLKSDGPTGTSNVGTLVANYMWDEANATVDIMHSIATDTRDIYAAGITIVNAETITVNAESNAIIAQISDGTATTLESLVLTTQGDISIETALEAEVDSVDASGVTGDATLSTDITGTVDFAVVGSATNTTLTMNADYTATANTSFTSAGTIDLNVSGDTNLTQADVSGIDTITVAAGKTLSLTMDQVESVEASDLIGADNTANLTITNVDEQKFVKADLNIDNITLDTLGITAQASVTLHAETDLTGIATLNVYDGTTLNLTAAQFQQLTNAGIITAVAGETIDFTVNITDLTQADVDAGFDLSGIDAAATVILNLAESVVMPSNGSVENADVINMGDNIMLTINTFEEVDGTQIDGGANSTLKFVDAVVDNSPDQGIQYPSIDASKFNMTYVEFLDVVAADINVDEDLFVNLPESVEKVIYHGEGSATPVTQIVTIEAQSTIDGNYTAFNKSGDEQNTVEIVDFTINIAGGVDIAGNIELSTDEKINGFNGNFLLTQGLQTVTINSTGTEANFVSNETANIIHGSLTPLARPASGDVNNTLTDVTINAEQALQMGGIIFNSWSEGDHNDGWTINDNDEAIATVTINGTANVAIGLLDSSDNDVDAMNVVNNGTGTVTATINAANIDADDALSFTGSNIELTVVGTVDLSDDNLAAVTKLTFADYAVVTMSQAQVNTLGVANIVADTDAATLNINAFDGSVAFDATLFDEQLDVNTITMIAGTNTLVGDFTDVGTIVVPEGGVLNLTAEQFNQIGAIVSFDTDGDLTAEAITVNITGMTQADAADFDSTKVAAAPHTVTLSLAADITLATATDIENVDTVIMTDAQTLSLVTQTQADALVTSSTGTTTINLEYDVNAGAVIDASGYDVTTLQVWSTAINGSDVEWQIDNLPNSVTLNIAESMLQIEDVADVNRKVIIEPGVAVPGFLVFNGDDADRELVTLEITFSGDATDRTALEDFDGNIEGSIIAGDLELDLDPDTVGDVNDFFTKLTLNSTGTGDSNGITGSITPIDNHLNVDAENDNTENNLLDIEINADADFAIGGSVIFNSIDEAQNAATLTVNGTADVSAQKLIVNGANIDTLSIANNDGGTLTITGASPSVEAGSAETLVLSGAGAMSFGTVEAQEDFADGITGASLSAVNASGLGGDLYIENISGVDQNLFAFTSGAGVTDVTVAGQTMNDDGDATTASGWSIDVSNAAVGSEVHLGANTYTDGSLTINLGTNTTLYIDADTDWTDINLALTQTLDIVLTDGAELKLTAAQADGLNIVGEGTVNVTELGTAAYDLSGIDAAVAGTTTLAADDVTLNAVTDLGSFSVTLIDSDESEVNGMQGQTIRFQTEVQAAREIIVEAGTLDDDNGNNDGVGVSDDLEDTGAASDTNVVWLFSSVSAPVNTDAYSSDLGRLWITPELADSANIENLYTSLPESIVRVEFSSLTELDVLLLSSAVSRTVELVSFTTLPNGMSFSDQDRLEHIESLTINMGGSVNSGDIQIGNLVDPSTGVHTDLIVFSELTINSERALSHDHYLATEQFVNDNDGLTEAGEHVQPANLNTVGDISVGADAPGLDLLTVNLNTLAVSTVGDDSAGSGANLEVGTITFDSDATGEIASLNVSGANSTTVAALNTGDADIATLEVNNFGPGALHVTGASAAAAVSNTEALIINATGAVTLGTAGDATKPGVSGDTLNLIDVNGAADVNLGVIASIDNADFELNTDDASGNVSAVMGDATAAPTLADGGVWNFDNSDVNAVLNLTWTEYVTLGAGTLNFDNVIVTIEGDVDFTPLADLTHANTTFIVDAGNSLTLTAAQANDIIVTETDSLGGTVFIGDLESDVNSVDAGVQGADLSTIDANVTITATLDATGDVAFESGNFAHADITVQNGEADATAVTLTTATFAVETGATVVLTAAQADGRVTTGAGTTKIEDIGGYAGAHDVNYATVATAAVNIAVDTSVALDAADDLGAAGAGRVISVADTMTLTSVGSTIHEQHVAGLGTLLVDDENDEGNDLVAPADTPITADLSHASVATIELDATAETVAGDTIDFPDTTAGQAIIMTALQADGKVVTGDGDVVVNDVDADVDGLFNLSAITATGTLTAYVDADATLDPATDLGLFDVVLNESAGGTDLTLTVTQLLAVGEADFSGTNGGDAETLIVNEYNGEDIGALGADLSISVLNVKAASNVALGDIDALANVETINVPADSSLTMTANQFETLEANGTTITGTGTVNLTEFDSENGNSINLSDGAVLTAGVTHGTITLDVAAASVTVDPTTLLDAAADGFTWNFSANNQTLVLSSETQADGRKITDSNTFTGSRVVLGFDAPDAADADSVIDAANYSFDNLWILDSYVANVAGVNGDFDYEDMINNLDSSVAINLFTEDEAIDFDLNPDAITTTNRVVTIEADTTVEPNALFSDANPLNEVATLALTLSGNSELDGDLILTTEVDVENNPGLFQGLTINSIGTGVNTIDGDITAKDGNADHENNLLAVVISATESLNITGEIEFSSRAEKEAFVLNLDDGLSIANNGSVTFTFNGVSKTVTNTTGSAQDEVWFAGQLAGAYAGWTAVDNGNGTVTFTHDAEGNVTPDIIADDLVFDINVGGNTNVTGTVEQYIQGFGSTDATATLTVDVAAGKTVSIGQLTTDDTDVDTLNATFTGAGHVTVGLSTVHTVDNDDTLNVAGSDIAGAITTLNVSSTNSLPITFVGDSLTFIDTMNFEANSYVTLTTEQFLMLQDSVEGNGLVGVGGSEAHVTIVNYNAADNQLDVGTRVTDVIFDKITVADGATLALIGDGALIANLELGQGAIVTMTAAQADAIGTITTDGADTATVRITDLQSDMDPGTLGVQGADLSTIDANVTITATLDATGDVAFESGNFAHADITVQNGEADVTAVTLPTATFAVETGATVVLTAAKADGRVTTGAGTTKIEDIGGYAGANDVNYATVATAAVNIAVDTSVALNAADDLGAAGAGRVISVADTVTLTSVGSTIHEQHVAGLGTLLVDDENDEGNDLVAPADTPITADLSHALVATIELDATAETVAGDTIDFPDTTAGQAIIMTALQADGKVVTGDGDVTVNDVDATATAFDLSAITATGALNAYVDADVTLANGSDFGLFDVYLNDDGQDDTPDNSTDLTLTAAQLVDTQTSGGNFYGTVGAVNELEKLIITNYTGENIAQLGNEEIKLNELQVASGNQTLGNITDSDEITAIDIAAGASLTMTVEQFLALGGTGVTYTGGGTLNLTGLTQAQVDESTGLDLDVGTDVIQGTLSISALDNIIVLDGTGADATDIGTFTIEMANNQQITLSNQAQADGRDFALAAGNDGTGVDVILGFDTMTGSQLDASGYGVIEDLYVEDLLVENYALNNNVENLLNGLPGGAEPHVHLFSYTTTSTSTTVTTDELDEDAYATVRLITIEPGTDIAGGLIVSEIDNIGGISSLTVTLDGDASITGDLDVSAGNTGTDTYLDMLQTLTINSNDSTLTNLNNKITGDVLGDGSGGVGLFENDLTDITVNTEEQLTIGGSIIFSSAAKAEVFTLTIDENIEVNGVFSDPDTFTFDGTTVNLSSGHEEFTATFAASGDATDGVAFDGITVVFGAALTANQTAQAFATAYNADANANWYAAYNPATATVTFISKTDGDVTDADYDSADFLVVDGYNGNVNFSGVKDADGYDRANADQAIAALIDNAAFAHWTTVDNGDGTVTFTHTTEGDVADIVAGDFVWVDNNALSYNLGSSANIDRQGDGDQEDGRLALTGDESLIITTDIDFTDEQLRNLTIINDIDDNAAGTPELFVDGIVDFGTATASVDVDNNLIIEGAGEQTRFDGVNASDLLSIDSTGFAGVMSFGIVTDLDDDNLGFALDAGAGSTSLTLDAAAMHATADWAFNFDATATVNALTFEASFTADMTTEAAGTAGSLTINNADAVYVTTDVDLGNIVDASNNDKLTMTATTFYISDGSRLIMRADQADAHTFTDGVSAGSLNTEYWYGAAAGVSIDASAVSGGNILAGTQLADTLVAGSGNDLLYGGAGDDTLTGGSGNDLLYGGAGDDTLTGGSGSDSLYGGSGSDSLYGGAGDDTFIYNVTNATSADADTIITDGFEVGAAADDIQIDISAAAGGIAANLADNTIVNIAASADNSFIVDTANTGYANFAAAEAAVEAAAGGGHQDYALMFFNTTSGEVEIYLDADSSAVGGEVQLVGIQVANQAAGAALMNAFHDDNYTIA